MSCYLDSFLVRVGEGDRVKITVHSWQNYCFTN